MELISRDAQRREKAATAIQHMRLSVSKEIWDGDELKSAAQFNSAIRIALEAKGFAKRRFLIELMHFMQWAQTERMQLWHDESGRTDRLITKLLARSGNKPKPTELKGLGPRMRKIICAGADPKNKNARLHDNLVVQQVAAGFVFEALHEQLLLVPRQFRELLRHKSLGYHAVRALERIGPPAVGFADVLFARLDACKSRPGFYDSRALANIIRQDRKLIQKVVNRLDSPFLGVACAAADTLGALGESAVRLVPDSINSVMRMSKSKSARRRAFAATTLGILTTGTDVAVDRLLVLSIHRDAWEKGAAISALGQIARQPERVVPRLIAAFDDFEEPDPDYTYYSHHERVVRALQGYGSQATSAVPALIRHIRNSDGDIDRGVLETLANLGNHASAALPILKKLIRQHRFRGDADIAKAIAKINAAKSSE
ncbi:MAG: HEAT repeat domain-containing protein [Gemmataceae bacterium]